jgi:hypothetical protein
VLVIAATVTALILHAVTVWRLYFVDDGFISLRYAKRLIQGEGLTYTSGERVEGYSNFLWTVLVALLGVFTPDHLLDVARVVGMVSMSLTLVLVLLGNAPQKAREIVPALAVGLALAGSTPIAAWSTGGLEQSLLGALVMAGIVLLYPRLEQDHLSWSEVLPAAIAFSLAVLTRPDACLFTATACIGFVVVRGFRLRAVASAARLAAIPLAVFVAHAVFRRLYYDAWVPNTYHAKVALGAPRARQGWNYLFMRPTPLAFLPGLALTFVAVLFDARRRRRVAFVVLPLVTWLAYLVAVGGDIMPEQRHMVLVFLFLALLGLEGLAFVATRWRLVGTIAAHVFATGLIVLAVMEWKRDPQRPVITRDPWERNAAPVGRFLKFAFGEQHPLLAVDAAGSTPYYWELDTLDMLGLNDRYIAAHPPPNFGIGALAHELGDAKYTLGRKPDLILFHVPPGQRDAIWRADREMQWSEPFQRLYRLVHFDIRGPRPLQALLWARHEDSHIGIGRQPNTVFVPGFLLSAQNGPAARFDDRGRLGTEFSANGAISYPLRLDAGSWQLRVDADGPLMPPMLVVPGAEGAPPSSEVQLRVSADVLIQLAAGASPVFVRSLRFDRTH